MSNRRCLQKENAIHPSCGFFQYVLEIKIHKKPFSFWLVDTYTFERVLSTSRRLSSERKCDPPIMWFLLIRAGIQNSIRNPFHFGCWSIRILRKSEVKQQALASERKHMSRHKDVSICCSYSSPKEWGETAGVGFWKKRYMSRRQRRQHLLQLL